MRWIFAGNPQMGSAVRRIRRDSKRKFFCEGRIVEGK
jgi:hypothetical protein